MEDEDIYDLYDDEAPKVCSLSSSFNRTDLDLLKRASKNSQYFCQECRRTANDANMLCSPMSL